MHEEFPFDGRYNTIINTKNSHSLGIWLDMNEISGFVQGETADSNDWYDIEDTIPYLPGG